MGAARRPTLREDRTDPGRERPPAKLDAVPSRQLQRLVGARPGGAAGCGSALGPGLVERRPPAAVVRPEEVAMLQRLAGNKATAALLATPERARGGGLARPLPVQRAKRSRAARRARQRAKARQRQQQQQVAAPQRGGAAGRAQSSGWSLGGLLGSAWGALGLASEVEGDKHLKGYEDEHQLAGDAEEEEEESLFKMPKLVIDLGEMSPESGDLTRFGGKAKASGSARLKAGTDGFEGSGGIEAEVGFDKNKEIGPFDFKLAGGELSGKGEVKGFFGARLGGEAEASWSGNTDVAAKGKISAFAGIEVESETEITLKGGGRELAHFKGALGMTVGGGGELSGHLSYKGGELRLGSKGKVAAGLGISWEYELHCSIAPLGSGLWSFLKSLGSAAHDFLTDEDGEPIHL